MGTRWGSAQQVEKATGHGEPPLPPPGPGRTGAALTCSGCRQPRSLPRFPGALPVPRPFTNDPSECSFPLPVHPIIVQLFPSCWLPQRRKIGQGVLVWGVSVSSLFPILFVPLRLCLFSYTPVSCSLPAFSFLAIYLFVSNAGTRWTLGNAVPLERGKTPNPTRLSDRFVQRIFFYFVFPDFQLLFFFFLPSLCSLVGLVFYH